MNTYAIPALKDKRARVAGEILALKRQIKRHRETLVSLDATIKIFDPSYKVGSIKSKDPRKRAKLFKLGELGRHIIDALRRADGRSLSTKELADAVIAAAHIGPDGRAIVAKSVRTNLAYLTRRGKVKKAGIRESARWGLTG